MTGMRILKLNTKIKQEIKQEPDNIKIIINWNSKECKYLIKFRQKKKRM